MQQDTRRAQVDHEKVHLAVVIVVGEARAARHGLHLEERSGRVGNVRKAPASEVAENRMLLRNHVDQAAVRDEDVAQPVVVEVVEASAPTHILRG